GVRCLSKDKGWDVGAGYCLANDVSERVFQIERAGQWIKGKSCESFGPLGPWFVTKDEIKDPQRLDMWLDVNGEKRQRGNTRTMIFDCKHLVWYCSQFFVLEPGDVITTGTPPGVALGMKPEPKYLEAGDVVTLGIDGLAAQRQKGETAKTQYRSRAALIRRSPRRGRLEGWGRSLRSPPGVKMVRRAAARADLDSVRGGERGGHVGLGGAHRLGQRKPLGEAGGDRGRQRAAGAVGILGRDAVGGETHECGRLDQEIDALGAATVTALDEHRPRAQRQQALPF